jgi:hypothetical protein
MNVLNRVLVSVFLLALAAAATSVAVLAWAAPAAAIDGLRDTADWLDRNDDTASKAALTAVAAGTALPALFLLLLEARRPSRGGVRVADVKGGEATLSPEALDQRIQEAVSAVPDVVEARAVSRVRRKGVELALDLHVGPDANLAAVADAALQAARDLLTGRLHVQVAGQPRVRLHYKELRLGRAAAKAGPAATSPTTQPPAAAAAPEPAAAGAAAPAQPDSSWRPDRT